MMDFLSLVFRLSQIPPQLYMEKDPEGKWTYRGSTKDVMDHLAKRFNFRFPIPFSLIK